MPTDIFKNVNDLIEEEMELYHSLEVLVDDEELKVAESDMQGLLDVLQKKQAIISHQELLLERWNEISNQLGLSSGREGAQFWNALAVKIGDNGYNQVVNRINRIRELGEKLLERETVIRKNLEDNLAEMRKTLLTMGHNRAAMKGYSKGVATYAG